MAKPFYSMDEAAARLGKTEDDIRDMVRDGQLREFRDAGKVFFKAEDVDNLAGDGGAADDQVPLEPVDEELPTLADTAGGTSVIGLEPIEEKSSGQKEDTAVVPAGGIGVFDDDELEVDADPMAKTQITEGGDRRPGATGWRRERVGVARPDARSGRHVAGRRAA